jgi:tRNA-splicing ligase RtcB
MEKKYSYHETDKGVPLKLWDSHGAFEEGAMDQLRNVASLPFIHKHVAGMPDVHWGMGATIGSVVATKGAIVPAAVGVDIGCGMLAVQTNLKASDLPDNLHGLRSAMESVVPHGRTDNGGKNDRGGWGDKASGDVLDSWGPLSRRYGKIIDKHPKAKAYNTYQHMGTLGTGNHFIEICLDENQAVWVMLHSGSRGAGNRIGSYFIEKAKEEMSRYYIDKFLPDKDLAYLVENTVLFDDYIEAVSWAQDYASENRKTMMSACIGVMQIYFPHMCVTNMAVNCHHNYVDREHHFGENVLVTRKGAVRARKGDLGIIPGSMGTGSFIVKGLGNADSFCSCSHGAGRKMSRGQAKKEITLEQHALAMKGIEARLDADVLDESPAAYKDIGAVMKAQDDLVEIVHRLNQVVNIKG